MNRFMIRNPSRKPQSCLGCIGSLIGIFLLAGIGYLVTVAIFAPWSYYLGGSFHLIPIWQGWGKLHSSSGDFVLYVLFSEPQNSRLGYPYISGTAELCTPRGEKFRGMHVIASFGSNHFGLNTDHQPVTINVYSYGSFGSFKTDHRPRFDLYGSWQNSDLVLEDHGSLASAFLADGEAYLGPEANQPAAGENIFVTLVPGGVDGYKAACSTAH